jgi:hypothetical protein
MAAAQFLFGLGVGVTVRSLNCHQFTTLWTLRKLFVR